MGIYIVQLLGILLSGLLLHDDKRDSRKTKLFLIISAILLVSISAFRSLDVGTDTSRYYEHFTRVKDMNFSEVVNTYFGVEKGYILYNWLIGKIGGGYWLILIINAIITNIPVLYYIYKNSPNILISVYMYVALYNYLLSFNAMRQFMVLGIFLFAFELLKKKTWYTTLAYIFLIFLASTIHVSAWILLLGILFILFKPTYKNLIALGIPILALFITLYFSPEIIESFLPLIRGYVQRYAGTELSQPTAIGFSAVLWVGKAAMYVIAIYMLYKHQTSLRDREKLNINSTSKNNSVEHESNALSEINDTDIFNLFSSSVMVLISVGISIVSKKMSIFYRMSYYFEIFLIILIPYILDFVLNNIKFIKSSPVVRNIIFMGVYLGGLVFYIYRLNSEWGDVIPYEFFW